MSAVLPYGILLLLAGGLSALLSCRIERALPLATLSSILVLYLAGLVSNLYRGFLIVICMGIAGVPILFIRYRRLGAQRFFSLFVTPGALGFLIFMVFSLVITNQRVLWGFDEFTHWGLAVKNMYRLDAFGNAPGSTVIFQTYPPAASLIEYFFSRFSSVLSESSLYRGLHFLLFSLLACFFSKISWKDMGRFALCGLLIGMLPLFTLSYYGYAMIYADCLLGVLFAFLLYHLLQDRQDAASLAAILLSASVLALTKDAGLGLVLLAAFIAFAKRISLGRTDGRCGLIHCLFAISAGVTAFVSWKVDCVLSGATDGVWEKVSTFSMDALWRILAGTAAPEVNSVIHGFFDMFFQPMFGFRLPVSTALILLFCVFFGLMDLKTAPASEKRSRRTVFFSVLVGFILYAFSVLAVHVFVFSSKEALMFTSFHRYINVYLLGVLLYYGAVCIDRERWNPISLILSVLLIAAAILPTELFRLNPAVSRGWRASEPDLSLDTAGMDPKADRILYVSEGTDGMDYYVARYTATPIFVDQAPESTLTAEALHQYSYLYIHQVTNAWIEQNQSLFTTSIQERTLYRIEADAGRSLLIFPVID